MTDIAARAELDRRRFRLHDLVRGRTGDPAWVRPALLALLLGAGLLYLVSLSASGWANAYYSGAVQAATKSWKAFFFGSFDSSNFITVDKPPASLWVMDLSARIFGVNSWSILAPQAVEGIAAVGLLYATVRRQFGATAGLIAGVVLALTPVAVLMFRFNNPDALLTLLLVASAYALTRSLDRGSTRWLALAGVFIGLAFLTKMLQALIVVPGFALVYLIAAPTPLRRRLLELLVAGVAVVVSAGWWVAIVALWPAGSRPYIGSSQDGTIINLIFGYNGFGRLTGNEAGSVGGAAGATGRWGPTGITRLFGAEMGTQIAWLIPASLLALVALLWLTRQAPRQDRTRAAAILWGSWFVVTGLVFSFMKGIIHPYYLVVLAPAIGALIGIGSVHLWRHRDRLLNRLTLAAGLVLTAITAYYLLGRAPDWSPWLRYAVLALAAAVAAGIVLAPWITDRRPVSGALAAAALLAAIAAPLAYSAQTATTPHSGALPTAGPGGRGGFGGRGFGGPGRFAGIPGQPPPGGPRNFPGGVPTRPPSGFPGGNANVGPGGFGRPGGRGGLGGLLNASTPSKQLVALLKANASRYRWVAAAVGANSAAGVQLATDRPILAIGGFNGSDPTPTLAQFQKLVAAGQIHYYLGGGNGGGFGGPGSAGRSNQIGEWVAQNYPSRTVSGVTLYDLTAKRG
jgi:4-amino-4-deoxy-L-arabinose transferase-like glycosyltransferase